MASSFFLIASRGHMATTWLANALNAIPDTFALHGNAPEAQMIDFKAPLRDQLAQLERIKPVKRCGFIHNVNVASVIGGVKSGELTGLRLAVVQLFRNPVMLAEAMASIVQRQWQTQRKYRISAAQMQADVLTDRWHHVNVAWPTSVKTAVKEGNESILSRLTGIWMRTSLEAREAGGYEWLVQHLAGMGRSAPFALPAAFRHEDYTQKLRVFSALVNRVSGEDISSENVVEAFKTPRTNQHRQSETDNPADVYRAWSAAERDMFDSICSTTSLLNFYSHTLSYKFPFLGLSESGSQAFVDAFKWK